jgi:lipoprotein-releasing system ATP-binding protein
MSSPTGPSNQTAPPARADQAGAIEVAGVHKSYRLGKTTLHVLRGVSFRIEPGEFVAIVGASGSGKSTLLHLLGLLDRPDRGEVRLGGVDVETLSPGQRNRVRCREVGFVFQFYHLLPELNVLENVLLPAKVDASTIAWMSRRADKRKQAEELLEHVGLKQRLKHRPKELSGGERQRVAIARALMNRPRFLLADEPTGNLDSQTGKQIMAVVRDVSREIKQTVVMVTHDSELAAAADRVLHLRDGKLAKP